VSALLHWIEDGQPRSARWRSESGLSPPAKVIVADDTLPADEAFRHASRGIALLWRGDYHNARHLLDAIARRVDRKLAHQRTHSAKGASTSPLEAFNAHRRNQAARARALAMVVLPFDAGHVLPLRRAPDVRQASVEAHGEATEPYVAPLRELLGIVGAHEWRTKGVAIPSLDARIHPHYGVFAPIRNEYIDLVAQAPLPSGPLDLAFDIGTGTGVLAAVLVRRGIAQVIATDNDPRAIACARDNIARLGMSARVECVEGEFFPAGRARLIVCNPPWIPALPSASIERAIFDPGSRMLKGFLEGLADRLEPGGEGWLILSDFAERLGLRTRDELTRWIHDAGLRETGRLDARPRHPKSFDATDPLHSVRAAEVTSLWRLARR
jgi:methylase of polypeptide subunit release factors